MNMILKVSTYIGVMCFMSSCGTQLSELHQNVEDTEVSDSESLLVSDNESLSDSASLYQRIQQLIQVEGCESSSQCGVIGIGARPCGGPEEYRVYSKTSTDESKLNQHVSQFNQHMKQSNKDNRRMGICVVLPKPSVQCLSNRCVISDDRSVM